MSEQRHNFFTVILTGILIGMSLGFGVADYQYTHKLDSCADAALEYYKPLDGNPFAFYDLLDGIEEKEATFHACWTGKQEPTPTTDSTGPPRRAAPDS